MIVICLSVRLSVRYGCIVAKRCKIASKLLLITNRKSHTGFQMRYKSLPWMTLKVLTHYGKLIVRYCG